MRIKYNGEYTKETRTYGCSRCGTGTTFNGKESYKTEYRMYYEGRLFLFKQGVPQEVDEIQGRMLTNKKYVDKDGTIKPSFEEVLDEPATEQ